MDSGKEAVEIMAAGVAMILLAAALSLVIKNIDMGKLFLHRAASATDNATSQAMSETFEKINNTPITIPASGAYALIGYNESYVKGITCYICNPSGTTHASLSESCLKEHMTGDVKIWATCDPADSRYTIYLSSELNELIHNSKRMGLPDITRLLTAYKDMIDTITCDDCVEVKHFADSCVIRGVHNSTKSMIISASYNAATGKYSIRLIP